ncbi:MAG: iron-containing alcohol dehydrogenase [Sedimentisphaerales bacterium]|nr:iron-containing alcohol dehydrogenase [Sedimentisphaerales bacterium]MBN2842728.1 iron-containing alcohol dehydrogenase [Sedimentisphaerales bacterium]
MNNFHYHNPTHIVFGKDTIATLADLIPADKKIILIYGGGSIKKNGVYDQVAAALKGRIAVEFAGIEPNPLYETCMDAVKLIKDKKIDFILAVGGGSVIDGSKFIAAAACYNGEPWDILAKGGEVKAALPLGTVLTLPATGTEMNGNSVISRKSSDEKLAFYSPKVYPAFSILDPETTYSLPKNQLRNGIVDAFVHVMEQYATYSVETPLQDRQAEAVVNTLVEISGRVLTQEKDYNASASFVWCTTQALNGLINCGVVQDWATHMIGHELTAFFGLAHAESLAIVLPGLWKHQLAHKQDKLAQLGERVWNIKSGSSKEKAQAAIDATVKFFHSVKMPTTLKDYNISAADIQKVVTRFKERGTVLGEHQNITWKEVEEILTLCL